jgi:hypothetical protein
MLNKLSHDDIIVQSHVGLRDEVNLSNPSFPSIPSGAWKACCVEITVLVILLGAVYAVKILSIVNGFWYPMSWRVLMIVTAILVWDIPVFGLLRHKSTTAIALKQAYTALKALLLLIVCLLVFLSVAGTQ